jgi:tripartite-type tricarboxylate transporter receptor subunit TctC
MIRGMAARRGVLGGAIALAAGPPRPSAAQPGSASPFPSRPLTWIVPFGPGGITDAAARIAAVPLGRLLGQAVVVENRPGAGGTIGAEALLRAPADGHTLLYGSQGPIAAAPALYRSLRYDPLRDFVPVHGLGAAPNLIVSPPARPWRTLAELVEAARRAPETITYGSPGVGTAPHLGAELLQQITGVRTTHAPYANGAQALNDLIGGRLDVMWDYPVTSLVHVREGRLRALAVTDERRIPLAPEVPTTTEAGLPGAVMLAWAGLFVARGTPPEAVVRLAAAARSALDDPKVVEFFDGTATVLWPEIGTDRFRDFLAAEVPRVAALIERSGARPG